MSLAQLLPVRSGVKVVLSIKVEPRYKEMVEQLADQHEMSLVDVMRALIVQEYKKEFGKELKD